MLAMPIQYTAHLPQQLASWSVNTAVSRDTLLAENERLEREVLLLQRRIQQLAELNAENVRLKALLRSSDLVDERVIIAEIIGIDSDPFRHEVVINKGSTQGLFKGQAVLDAAGLMGQVSSVGLATSRVLLISDMSHGIPVHVARNGVRAIAVGAGTLDTLRLIHVPATADIVAGDLLVSSGLGGRFPKGYPVGTVTHVELNPGRPFARVDAAPAAHLDRSRHVLLVFPGAPVAGEDSDQEATDE